MFGIGNEYKGVDAGDNGQQQPSAMGMMGNAAGAVLLAEGIRDAVEEHRKSEREFHDYTAALRKDGKNGQADCEETVHGVATVLGITAIAVVGFAILIANTEPIYY